MFKNTNTTVKLGPLLFESKSERKVNTLTQAFMFLDSSLLAENIFLTAIHGKVVSDPQAAVSQALLSSI